MTIKISESGSGLEPASTLWRDSVDNQKGKIDTC